MTKDQQAIYDQIGELQAMAKIRREQMNRAVHSYQLQQTLRRLDRMHKMTNAYDATLAAIRDLQQSPVWRI